MAQFEITPDSFRSKMNIPPEMQKQHDLAVRAGLKLMFSPDTRDQTLEYMESEADMPQKIADGVMAIMNILFEKSNGTMPGQLIIPVGVELISHCVDVGRKAGLQVEDADVADGVAKYIQTVLQSAGATPEQMQQMLGGIDSGQQAPGGVA